MQKLLPKHAINGWPMSVNDEEQFPWLTLEQQFVREFIATGKSVLKQLDIQLSGK